MGKAPEEAEEKSREAAHMLPHEVWFTLNLEPKYIVREFVSHVRSTMLYGAELLSKESRKPFIEIDNKITNMFLSKLLKLGRNTLARKHQLRIKLALDMPTLDGYREENTQSHYLMARKTYQRGTPSGGQGQWLP